MSDVIGTLLYDEKYTLKDATVLHLTLDVIDIQSLLQDYTAALQDTRLLPYDLQNLSPADPIIRYLIGLNRGFKDPQILARARSYYTKQLTDAQSNAFLLCLFSADDNVLTNIPTPYLNTAKSLPGILDMPAIEKDLSNETEYRLKQLLDEVTENPTVMSRIQEIISEFTVRFNRMGRPETDKLGFQSVPVDQPLPENPQPDSLQFSPQA